MSNEPWKCPKSGKQEISGDSCPDCGAKKPDSETCGEKKVLPKETTSEPVPSEKTVRSEKLTKNREGVIFAVIIFAVICGLIAVITSNEHEKAFQKQEELRRQEEAEKQESERLRVEKIKAVAEKAFANAKVVKECKGEKYQAVEDLLQKAEKEMKNKDYHKAEELFNRAQEYSSQIVEYECKTTGKIDSEGIVKTIRNSSAAVKRCYDKALLSDPALQGKVSLTVLINENGTVESSYIAEETLKNVEVINCIKGEVGKLHFPKPEGGPVSVTIPYIFSF